MSMPIDDNLMPPIQEPHPPGSGPAPRPAGSAPSSNREIDPALIAEAALSVSELANLEAVKELLAPMEAANVSYAEFLIVSAIKQEWASEELAMATLASLSLSDPQRWPNLRPQYLANSNGVSMMSHAMGIGSLNVQDRNRFEFHYAEAVAGNAGHAASAVDAKNKGISSTGPEDFLDQVNTMFDPDRTAGRLTDFAVSLYPLSREYKQLGDTPEARQAHAARMNAALDQAYAVTDQTAGDDLTGAQIAGLAQSRQGVKTGLAAFVSQGADPEKATEGGLYDRLRTYAVSGRSSYAGPAPVNPADGVAGQHPAMNPMADMLDLEA